jgi:hypothetical protein
LGKTTKLYNVEFGNGYQVMFTFDHGKRHKVVSFDDLDIMATFYEDMHSVDTTNKALALFHEKYPDAKDVDEHHLELTKLRIEVVLKKMRGAK